MTIEQLDTTKVLISLGNEDMKSFDLHISTMSFYSEKSKKVLLRLLNLACMKAGLSCKNKSVLMEALPHRSGCLILVTMLEQKKGRIYKVRGGNRYPCFVFENAEKLLCAAEEFYRQKIHIGGNSLWLWKDKYYLVSDSVMLKAAARRKLMEYSAEQRVTSVQISRIKEQGRVICPQKGLETIGRRIASG